MHRFRSSWVALVLGCISLNAACASAPTDPWVTKQFGGDARILCNVHKHGEQFVVALLGDKVMLGYRLDMTAYNMSHSFTAGWRLLGENHQSLVARIPPQALRDEYIKEDGKIFAEGIQIQTLTTSMPTTLHAMMHIRKCRSAQCDVQPGSSQAAAEYTVDVCVASFPN